MVTKPIATISDHIRPNTKPVVLNESGTCDACGFTGPYKYIDIITERLAHDWNLPAKERKAFSARESMFCMLCGCSYRLRALARAISLYIAPDVTDMSLKSLIEQKYADKLVVAEINSCGVLHSTLAAMPKLKYSEYGSKNKAVPDEDLMDLSYADGSLDLVLTSDSLEHVPNPSRALQEIHRVLKPNGAHIFTVPMRLNHNTVERTVLTAEGKPKYVKHQSYHGSGEPDYLVWNEFGTDFIDAVQEVYPTVSLFFTNVLDASDPSCVIVAYKTRQRESPHVVEAQYATETTVKAASKIYGTGLLPRTESPSYVEKIQLQGLLTIGEKLTLTQDHANNLEAIVADQREYVAKQNEEIRRLNVEYDSALRFSAKRVINKLPRRQK